MTQDLVILGIGGFGLGALEIAERINEVHAAWNILGFLDDDPSHHGEQINDYPVLGDRSWLLGYPRVCVAVCVGSPAVRHRVVAAIEAAGHRSFATLCHPSAQLARRMSVGAGSIIAAGVLVDTGTTIGRHVLLSRGASVGHDVVIGEFVNISPSGVVAGHCRIGTGCEVGSNATLIPGKEVGAWSTIGAGAVVTTDLPPNVTAVGIPARVAKQRPENWHLEV